MALDDFRPDWRHSGVPNAEKAEALRHGLWRCLEDWTRIFPGRLNKFAIALCEMGHDIDSVERELDEICNLVRGVESRNWLAFVCDGVPASEGWRAAGWLIKWPDELGAGALQSISSDDRMEGDQTQELCEGIQEYVATHLKPAKEEALNHAIVSIAKQNQLLDGRRRAVLPLPPKSIIQESMKRHPDLSFREICGRVDDRCETEQRQIPVPRKCKKHGHKTLVDSIDCYDCRKYMKSFLSTERSHLGLHRPPKSEFPRKTKVAKLDKVRK